MDLTIIAQYINPVYLIPVIVIMLCFVVRNIIVEYKNLKKRL